MAISPQPTTSSENPLSDASISPFLSQNFSPVDYLNSVIPDLHVGSSNISRTSSISEVTNQCQSQIAQISSQLTRLSATLTRLTDDILRSGSRLSYEVEVLRGSTASLTETLSEGIVEDLRQFTSDHNQYEHLPRQPVEGRDISQTRRETFELMQRLKMLVQVRNRLDDVVKVFGQAMEWPIPPPEPQKSTSIASSLIVVSAPESTQRLDEGGQEYAEKLRREVIEMMDTDGGLEAAQQRIEDLRDLATVWKGTNQGKGRARFVESLEMLVEDKVSSSTKRIGASQNS